MPVGRHRDMARLEPEPFAVVDPHPVVIDGIAKDRCGKSALAACERPGCRHGRRVLMSLMLILGSRSACRIPGLAKDRFINNPLRSEEHTSELQSLMRISYAVFCLTTKNIISD